MRHAREAERGWLFAVRLASNILIFCGVFTLAPHVNPLLPQPFRAILLLIEVFAVLTCSDLVLDQIAKMWVRKHPR
jgi:hypothetical protein